MARSNDIHGAIAERARKTLGLITIEHLDDLGISRQQRRSLVRQGAIQPVAARVMRHAAWPPSWEQAVLAAVLAAGSGAVASHMSAAALWRFDGIKPGAIEVTVPWPRQPEGLSGLAHRSRDIPRVDVDARGLIPRTTPSRTLLDIAPRFRPPQLEQALDGAERDGLVWRPHLRWRVDELRRRGRPGISMVEELLDRTDGRPLGESWLEQEALRLIRRAGLAAPRCQVKLRKAGGGMARVDLHWDDVRLIVELDGHGTHATRRQRQADAERRSRLVLAGWSVVHFTYEDVTERPDYVIETIRQHLNLAR